MSTYKIVKYCRICRKRFTVLSGRSATYYCEACFKKIKKEQSKE